MTRYMRQPALPLIGIATLLLLGTQEVFAQPYDTVVRVRGGTETALSGLIQSLTRERIDIQVISEDGRPRSERVLARELKEFTINYRLRLRGNLHRGQAFADGRAAMLDQRWAQAARHFAATVDTTQDELARHVARVHLVQCGLELGTGRVRLGGDQASETSGFEIAVTYADQVRRHHAESYYLADVLAWAGTAHENLNNPGRAIELYNELAAFDRARGTYRLAEVRYRQRDWSDARDSFRTALAAAQAANNTSLVERCNVYIGRCSIELGDWQRAQETFERLVGPDGSDNFGILGAAYLGLGRCHVNAERWLPAFHALATAATVFKTHLSDHDMRFALGLCVRVAEQLGRDSEEWQARAERLRQEFNQLFRGASLPDLR